MNCDLIAGVAGALVTLADDLSTLKSIGRKRTGVCDVKPRQDFPKNECARWRGYANEAAARNLCGCLYPLREAARILSVEANAGPNIPNTLELYAELVD
jgi:hypothetical protein